MSLNSFRLGGTVLPALGLALLVTMMASEPALAISAELKCQDTIAIHGRNFFKKRYTAIAKCEDKKASGALAQATNCRPDVGAVTDQKTSDKLSDAADKLTDKLDTKCTDAIVAGLTLGIPCGTTVAVAQLTSCIIDDAHGENADLLIESVYNDAGELTYVCDGGDNDGLLCDPRADLATECPNGGTECRSLKDVRLCQKAMSTAARNYAKDRMTARRGCAKKQMSGKLDPPCPDAKALAKMEKALAKFRKKVLKKCTDAEAADAALQLGFPCESFLLVTFERDGATFNNLVSPSERLVRCVAAAAAGDGDLGNDTAYPLPDVAPFSYGVAAGEATENAFIAWTRTDGPGTVTLEVATDGDFSAVVYTDSSLNPDAAADNVVKTDVTGLLDATQYYYRFEQGGLPSRTGRIRTAPLGVSTGTVSFVWTGDSNAFYKPYTVLDGIVADDPDLWLFIGDTIYSDDERTGTGVATTRSEYHDKYKENWSDSSLRNVMASVGTLTTWDDHEVTNDFYGTDPAIQTQMEAGNQAFFDYMPIGVNTGSASATNTGSEMQLYRSFQWGAAVEFFLLDVRQYRDAQAYWTEPECGPTDDPDLLPNVACQDEIDDGGRAYLGDEQKEWLKQELSNSTAQWKFLMNGPLISELMFLPYDRWEGYSAEREEILEYIEANNIENVVFLSTDIHALIVNSEAVNPGPSGGGTPEWVAGAIGMDPIFRELPPTVGALVSSFPFLFPAMTNFDIDRFNYGLVEVGMGEARLSYRDNTGAIIHSLTFYPE